MRTFKIYSLSNIEEVYYTVSVLTSSQAEHKQFSQIFVKTNFE